MAATKASASLLAGVTTTQTSSAVDCSTHYGNEIYPKLVVVGTPTASATWTPQWSPDAGTTYYDGPTFSAPLVAGTYYFGGAVSIPASATRIKISFVAQTGGTSGTFTAQLGEVTGI